jgi:hypothetical protein
VTMSQYHAVTGSVVPHHWLHLPAVLLWLQLARIVRTVCCSALSVSESGSHAKTCKKAAVTLSLHCQWRSTQCKLQSVLVPVLVTATRGGRYPALDLALLQPGFWRLAVYRPPGEDFQ